MNLTGQESINTKISTAPAVGAATTTAPVVSELPSLIQPQAATSVLHLNVQSARQWLPSGLAQGQVVPHYKWLIVHDDTGNPDENYGSTILTAGLPSLGNAKFDCKPQSLGGDPQYPANCQWPSIHSVTGGTSAQVFAEGDDTTLNTTTGPTLPAGKYMISVTADGFTIPGCVVSATVSCKVDGFMIDGSWFTAPLNQPGSDPGLVVVQAQPYPIPLTTVRMKVWNDIQTNGTFDENEVGLAGFTGHINDIAGEVTDDWFGNPLCTVYKHDVNGNILFDTISGKPLIQTLGGHCLSNADGIITIPYLGPNRYAATVVAPNGTNWIQDTSLEGSLDWDTWAIQGWDGNDAEFVKSGEPFPFAEFGFVQPLAGSASAKSTTTGVAGTTGEVKGVVVGIGAFAPPINGIPFGSVAGNFIIGPIKNPVLSLVDLLRNDATVYVGRGNPDGTFDIKNVPDGDYSLAYWDAPNDYLVTTVNLGVRNGQVLDLGNLDTFSWFSYIHGKVCMDANRNGKCDPGESGIPGLTLNLLSRDNSLQDQGSAAAITDKDGNYTFPEVYPLGQWVVEQAYFEGYYTVGVDFQTNNQPADTQVMANGGFVDVSTYNIIGMNTRFDWAVHTYETNPALGPTTGGLVGEMVYHAARLDLDPRFAAAFPNEPGIPNFSVHLYAPVKCDPVVPATIPAGTKCTSTTTSYGTTNYLTDVATGALKKLSDGTGIPIDMNAPYISETWRRPVNCTARGFNGAIVSEQLLPPSTGGFGCLEAPLMSSQVSNNGLTDQFAVAGDGQFVNGNYGFTTVDHDPVTGAALAAPITIPAGDYIVEPVVPKDPFTGKPLWEVTKEEDVNTFSGDQYVAPGETPNLIPTPLTLTRSRPAQITPLIPPALCVGPLHTVHVVNNKALALFDPTNPSAASGVYNPDFLANGGSPYEGQQHPMCSTKLVTVRSGRSTTPNFYFKPTTDVALPGRMYGLVVDDLNLSTDPHKLTYGEKYGIPNLPIGIYDFANRLLTTVNSDTNGLYEVLLPSTSTFNCANPDPICPGMYRFLANDPGQPGHVNANYNPAYRTIGTFFQVWPGITLNPDQAPTPTAMGIEGPGVQHIGPPQCLLNDPAQTTAPKIPEVFAVDKPYIKFLADPLTTDRNITITGQNFGAAVGNGQVTLSGSIMPILSWSDRKIVFGVPVGMGTLNGEFNMRVKSSGGQWSFNSLTFRIVGGPQYNPTIYEVGPGRPYNSADLNPTLAEHAIQRALDAAASNAKALVVVYPNTPALFNPLGAYNENVIMHSPVQLQGVGPGGVYSDNSYVPGSVLDGTGFGTDSARTTAWAAELAAIGPVLGPQGNPAIPIPEGEVILAVAKDLHQYTPLFKAEIDGFLIEKGNVMDFTTNINDIGGGPVLFGEAAAGITNTNQGGGIAAFAYTKYLQITNNILRSNSGSYGGAIRLGTPYAGNNNLDGAHIAYNRILNNGGSNLAGGIGVFNGTPGYEINNNDICGNFSAEYGGGISAIGLNPGGKIHDNRIYFNQSYDEGAGVMIAGEIAPSFTGVSAGAGAADIYNNILQSNLGNDDGGGLRFLMAGNFPFNVYNNMIVNNISTHEGGGVAIDDAPNVRFMNNTVMKNLTTATAATSNGLPAAAGLITGQNSVFFQATLPAGSPIFSKPLLFNNIFWDNRAGSWDGAHVTGIGLTGDPNPINYWDMGVPDGSGVLSPTNSILHVTTNPGIQADPTNIFQDPLVVSTYDTTILSTPWRGNLHFVGNVAIALDVPISIMGDYHLSSTASPAYNTGAAVKATVAAPTFDIDNQPRPAAGAFDIGADEIWLPGTIFQFFYQYMPVLKK